jgi:protein O-mannosyl-transferase
VFSFFKNKKNILAFLIFTLGGFILYSYVTLYGKFLFDDNLLIENNILIRSLSNFFKFFTSNSEAGSGLVSNFYRPLQQVVYAVIYKFFVLQPFMYHAVPVAIHIINSFLIFVFLRVLEFSYIGALLSVLIFLVHPVQCEAIAYVSGIADPLGFMFLMFGILSFIKLYKEPNKSPVSILIISAFCFACALLSKESTVIFFPIVIILSMYFWENSSKKQKTSTVNLNIFFFLLLLVYLFLKFKILNFTDGFGLTNAQNIYTQNIFVRLITFVNILWEYVKLLFYPVHLYLEKPYIGYVTLLSLRGIFGLILILSSLFFMIKSFFSDKKIIFLGISLIWISLIPMSGIVPINAMYLEHWLYFSFIGICILLVVLYDKIKNKKIKILYVILYSIFFIFFCVRTYERNDEWADPIKFYENELSYNYGSTRVHNNIAMEYSDIGDFNNAIKHYKIAIEQQDVYPQTHHNLGNVYLSLIKYDEALQEYIKAINIDPNFFYSYGHLVNLYLAKKDEVRARICYDIYNKIRAGQRISREEIKKINSKS